MRLSFNIHIFLTYLEGGVNERRHHNPYLFQLLFHCQKGIVLGTHMDTNRGPIDYKSIALQRLNANNAQAHAYV